MTEWRRIPAHPGYEASDDRRVRSVDRTLSDGRAAGGQVLAVQADKDGYRTVKLGRKRYRVARLVALAFHGPPEVDHLNGDRQDDSPGNLDWCSRREQERRKRKNGKRNKEEKFGTPPLRTGTPLGQ